VIVTALDRQTSGFSNAYRTVHRPVLYRLRDRVHAKHYVQRVSFARYSDRYLAELLGLLTPPEITARCTASLSLFEQQAGPDKERLN
jgi:hypothetical protein